MTRIPASIPEQGELISHTMWGSEVVNETPLLPSLPIDGPSVRIDERANALNYALANLGKISQKSGFQRAIETPYRRDIEDRYENVDAVAAGVDDNKAILEVETKRQFARAFGRTALIDSGMLSEEDATQAQDKDYRLFIQRYADSPNRKARDSFRKTIIRNEKSRASHGKTNS